MDQTQILLFKSIEKQIRDSGASMMVIDFDKPENPDTLQPGESPASFSIEYYPPGSQILPPLTGGQLIPTEEYNFLIEFYQQHKNL